MSTNLASKILHTFRGKVNGMRTFGVQVVSATANQVTFTRIFVAKSVIGRALVHVLCRSMFISCEMGREIAHMSMSISASLDVIDFGQLPCGFQCLLTRLLFSPHADQF